MRDIHTAPDVDTEIIYKNEKSLLAVMKEYLSDLWEVRKFKLYGDSCPT